jgi:poly(glycerol-phosphate) alpha-glucosyltransferase
MNKYSIEYNIYSFQDKFTNIDSEKWGDTNSKVYKSILCGRNNYFSIKILIDLWNSKADIGHIQALWSFTSIALYVWARLRNRKYLLSSNGYLDTWALNKSKIKKKIALYIGFNAVIYNAYCIQVNNIREIQSVRQIGYRGHIAVIPNGINILDETNINPPWPTNVSNKILLYLGRIDEKKGVDLLINAWNLVQKNDECKDWTLVIVGFSENLTNYELCCLEIINKQKNNSILYYNGQYGLNMNSCYHNANAFILPSFSEGNPIAALNAMISRKPVLITPHCNIKDNNSKKFGIFFEPSVNEIILALKDLFLMSEDELRDMGENAFNYANENNSWESVSFKYDQLYNWMNLCDTTKPSFIHSMDDYHES